MSTAERTNDYALEADEHQPLTPKEKALLERLLSDPFSYPMGFKTWIVRSLEVSDLALSMSNVVGLPGTLGIGTGSCVLYAGTDTPRNSLLCNGGTYTTSAYPELFRLIGYGFGGSGANFQVPNIAAPGVGLKYLIVT